MEEITVINAEFFLDNFDAVFGTAYDYPNTTEKLQDAINYIEKAEQAGVTLFADGNGVSLYRGDDRVDELYQDFL